jgi:hypothetical protein
MNNKKISKKREKSLAKDIGGRATPGSGNKWFEKSDAYNSIIRFEDKFTKKGRYSIHLSELKKIEKEAILTNKIPILRFGFHHLNQNYVIINNDHFFDTGVERDIKGIDIKGKSITIDSIELNNLYLQSKCIILLILNFVTENRLYFVLRYEVFLDNIEKFYSIF